MKFEVGSGFSVSDIQDFSVQSVPVSTLSAKNVFLISNQNFPYCNLCLWPLLLCTSERKLDVLPTLHIAALYTIGLHCCKDTLLTHAQDLQILPCKTAFYSITANLYCFMRLCCPRGWSSHITFLNFVLFPSVHFSSLSGSLWTSALHSSSSNAPSLWNCLRICRQAFPYHHPDC